MPGEGRLGQLSLEWLAQAAITAMGLRPFRPPEIKPGQSLDKQPKKKCCFFSRKVDLNQACQIRNGVEDQKRYLLQADCYAFAHSLNIAFCSTHPLEDVGARLASGELKRS